MDLFIVCFFLFKLESPQEAQINEQAFEMMKDFLPEVNFLAFIYEIKNTKKSKISNKIFTKITLQNTYLKKYKFFFSQLGFVYCFNVFFFLNLTVMFFLLD